MQHFTNIFAEPTPQLVRQFAFALETEGGVILETEDGQSIDAGPSLSAAAVNTPPTVQTESGSNLETESGQTIEP